MAPLPVKIRPRLGQLVRMLSSPADGEVVAAVRALARTLASEGRSFHDLAEAIEADKVIFDGSSFAYDAWEPAEPAYKGPPSWHNLREFERNDWLSTFVRKLDIPDKEEMRALVRFRSECLSPVGMWRPSRRQLDLFRRLIERAWRLGVRP